jgi:hypothetical protein
VDELLTDSDIHVPKIVADDHESHTVFKSNGYVRYMKGYFCCEVEFGSLIQPGNIAEFEKLIRELDGQSP